MKSNILRSSASTSSRKGVTLGKSKSAIQRPTSQHQLGKKPSSAGRRKPVKRCPTCNCCSESRTFKYAAFVMTLLLFTGAITMIILYFRRLKKLSEKSSTMAAIRKIMIQQNQSFEGKSDAEIVEGAQQSAKHLLDWTLRNEELQHVIDSTIEKMINGWKRFGGNLYYFSTPMLSFANAAKACKNNGSMVTDIISGEEEDFVENETIKDHSPYWIGLMYNNGTWLWGNNQSLRTQ